MVVADWSVGEELSRHIQRRGYSLDRLARESGISKATLYRWMRGQVERPYYWENLLYVAGALNLTRVETDRLLYSIRSPLIETLYPRASPQQQELMSRWVTLSRNNLPGELTSFIGREVEMLQTAWLLSQDDVRLVTLTGPGGAGKTRLSLRVAGELHDVFPDGIFFVPLATVSDPQMIVPAIARTLGIRDVPGQSTDDRLTGYLRQRRLLLVLDNAEHLIDAAPDIVSLLETSRHVTVLVTSRIPLRVSCEHVQPVTLLDAPDPDAGIEDVRESLAVQLFTERARAVNAAFSLDEQVAGSVATICARLEGSPLAIELAAARCRNLSPDDILQRFPGRLDLGADGEVDRPDRQRSLRSAIDWSYDLLSLEAQVLFRHLAVFSGGWPADAVPAVCDGSPASLTELAEASLVFRVADERYGMLETLAEYAREHLLANNEDATMRVRHAHYYLELAESAQPYIPQSRQDNWLELVDREYDNIRSALQHLSSQGDREGATRLAAALWPFWHEYGRPIEGEHWLSIARDLEGGSGSETDAELLTGLLYLTFSRSDLVGAERIGEEALALWRALDNPRGIALVLICLGQVRYTTGDFGTPHLLFGESLALWRSIGEPLGIARCLSELATLSIITGDGARALQYLEEAVAIYERVGDRAGLTRSRLDLGLFAMLSGDLHTAIPALIEGVGMCRMLGDNHHLGWGLFYLGASCCFAGDLETASAALEESLGTQDETGSKYGMAFTMLGFAALRHRQGRHEVAATLCGAVTTLLQLSGISMNPAVHQIYLHESHSVREALGAPVFERAYAAGRDLTIDEAVATALHVPE